MGYTHYMRVRPTISPEKWAAFTDGVRKIFAHPDVRDIICREADRTAEPPEIGEGYVVFNGKGRDGHETFYMERVQSEQADDDRRIFSFCKTAMKPYDAAVCAVLLAAARTLGDDVRITSDGSWESWVKGRKIY